MDVSSANNLDTKTSFYGKSLDVQSCAKIIEETVKNGVVPVGTSN